MILRDDYLTTEKGDHRYIFGHGEGQAGGCVCVVLRGARVRDWNIPTLAARIPHSHDTDSFEPLCLVLHDAGCHA